LKTSLTWDGLKQAPLFPTFDAMKDPVTVKTIDIEHVFKSKNPRLYRFLPGFIFRYLKRIIHQDEINQFLRDNCSYHDVDFAQRILEFFRITVKVEGLEHVPEKGGCILACNHPIGSVDAMALITTVASKRKDIKFLVNDILMNLENLRGVFMPVNKHGKNPQNSLREMESLYASDQVSMVFPAGLVSRKQDGLIRDLDWKKSFLTKARKYTRLIVPVYISGRNSDFFYNLGNFRKALGIQANIEMLFLANETFSQRDNTITLIFGEPIRPEMLSNKTNDHVWAGKIKRHVYTMGDAGKPLPFEI
jgi:putative hemolysin